MTTIVGLSRDRDKNEEFILPCGLILGRSIYQEASTWHAGPHRHMRHYSGIKSAIDWEASAVLSPILLHMPRSDRQSILPLAYRIRNS